jgi:hypothetical protein
MTPTQKRDFSILTAKLALKGLLMGLIPTVVIIVIALAFPDEDIPLPIWLVVAVPVFIATIVPVVALTDYWAKTRSRANDPFRFATFQTRSLTLTSAASPQTFGKDIERIVQGLDYDARLTSTSESFSLIARRAQSAMLNRFDAGEERPDQEITIEGFPENGSWHVKLTGKSLKRFSVGDLTLTTYLSLEELEKAIKAYKAA